MRYVVLTRETKLTNCHPYPSEIGEPCRDGAELFATSAGFACVCPVAADVIEIAPQTLELM